MIALLAVAAWEIPAIIAGVIVAIGVVGKALRDVYNWSKSLEEKLDYVAQEMKFNGGSTMRDAVLRIEDRQQEAEGHRLAIEQKAEQIEEKVEDLETHLTAQDDEEAN